MVTLVVLEGYCFRFPCATSFLPLVDISNRSQVPYFVRSATYLLRITVSAYCQNRFASVYGLMTCSVASELMFIDGYKVINLKF